jgi:hypothetical protein
MITDVDADVTVPTPVPKYKQLTYNNIQIINSKPLSHFGKFIPGEDDRQKGAVNPGWDGSRALVFKKGIFFVEIRPQ